MNTVNESQGTDQLQTRKRRIKKVMQIVITFITLTIVFVTRPQVSSAGGSCSTTSGDCSGSITLYLG